MIGVAWIALRVNTANESGEKGEEEVEHMVP